MDIALKIANTRLCRAVVIRITRDTKLLSTRNKRFTNRVNPINIGNWHQTRATAVFVITLTNPRLSFFKKWQDVGVTPAWVTRGSPVVKIFSLAAVVHQAVNRC